MSDLLWTVDPGSQWKSEATELAGRTVEAKIDDSTRQLTGKVLIEAESATAVTAGSTLVDMMRQIGPPSQRHGDGIF